MEPYWIVGTSLISGKLVALPAGASMCELDMVAYRDDVDEEIAELRQQASHIERLPDPSLSIQEHLQMIEQIAPGILSGLPTKAALGASTGSKIDNLLATRTPDLVVYYHGNEYPLKDPKLVTFAQLLALRTMIP